MDLEKAKIAYWYKDDDTRAVLVIREVMHFFQFINCHEFQNEKVKLTSEESRKLY